MDLNEANKFWFNSEPIDGVLFGLNDWVRIKSGEYEGKNASVISLISIEPTTYLVELGGWQGGDVIIAQTELESGE
ncbi:MAG TPA: hypothetical protein VNB22_07010 [Pyrinomonadaceae bacterium]|jgi:hypothetical protein|nr:hypothetical protein [Pyrinomonadaceae bacterium]